MKLAIVGTRGIPNNYGGFETLAEQLVEYLGKDVDITVYCSSKDIKSRPSKYKEARLKYIPITSHGALGILYDSISLLNAANQFDKILFLGFGGGFAIPFLRKKTRSKIVVNIGGLDWQRNKWSPFAQKIIKRAERLLIKYSNHIISDNQGIQNYLAKEYGLSSTLIAYGGDQAKKQTITEQALSNYPFLKKKYAFSVTRIQPDNNIDMILEGFKDQDKLCLVIVGNWNNSSYGKYTRAKYQGNENLILLDAIYDREKLDVLRSNCEIYIHGHSAGGTNPSLVEAMNLGLPIFAFASGYNEYTTEHQAFYFKNAGELRDLVMNYETLNLKASGKRTEAVALKAYRWDIISEKYKQVLLQ